ncbi:hypothetical protein A8B98_04650 [Hymenobacter sp. UV11]|nr:hypothetical protein A8B98_04650 [Hymenobacter sp. UV11]
MLLVGLLLLAGVGHAQGRHPKFFETAVHGKYKPGFYTLADGTRQAGSLRIWQDLTRSVVQIDQGKVEPLNLQLAELRGCIIGADSFLVARQVGLVGAPNAHPLGEFALLHLILKGQLQVLEHDQLVGSTQAPHMGAGGIMYGGGGPQHLRTWVLRPTPTAELLAVPQGEQEFAQHMAGLFVAYPALCQRIRAGLEGPRDFKRIIYAFMLKQDITLVSFEKAATIFP